MNALACFCRQSGSSSYWSSSGRHAPRCQNSRAKPLSGQNEQRGSFSSPGAGSRGRLVLPVRAIRLATGCGALGPAACLPDSTSHGNPSSSATSSLPITSEARLFAFSSPTSIERRYPEARRFAWAARARHAGETLPLGSSGAGASAGTTGPASASATPLLSEAASGAGSVAMSP